MKSDERRAQLIRVAHELFFNKGYEDTTMADIIEAAGVSKGGFYHHFNSKDALFFGLLDELVSHYEMALVEIASDATRPALDRLVDVLASEGNFLSQSKLGPQVQIIEVMNVEKNLGMSARFNKLAFEMLVPILTKLVEQGKSDGTIQVDDPAATAEIVAHLMRAVDHAQARALNTRQTPDADTAAERLSAVLEQQYRTIDMALGIPVGTTSYGWPGYVDAIMAVPR